MKTVTEFSGFLLAQLVKNVKELKAAGKTPDELSQTIGESQKVEGDKLKLLMCAIDEAEGRPDSLKRIVVWAGTEGEKGPSGAVHKEGHYFVSEYFFVPPPKRGRGDRQERGGRRGEKGERSGRGERAGRGRKSSESGGDEKRFSKPSVGRRDRPDSQCRPDRSDKNPRRTEGAPSGTVIINTPSDQTKVYTFTNKKDSNRDKNSRARTPRTSKPRNENQIPLEVAIAEGSDGKVSIKLIRPTVEQKPVTIKPVEAKPVASSEPTVATSAEASTTETQSSN